MISFTMSLYNMLSIDHISSDTSLLANSQVADDCRGSDLVVCNTVQMASYRFWEVINRKCYV